MYSPPAPLYFVKRGAKLVNINNLLRIYWIKNNQIKVKEFSTSLQSREWEHKGVSTFFTKKINSFAV